jgi:hypothetical protein
MRIWIMRSVSAMFVLEIVGHTLLSLLRDRATYKPWVLVPSLLALRHSPFLAGDVLHRLRSYNRRGFHPDDWDATALIEHWKTELFGEHGTLTDHLR